MSLTPNPVIRTLPARPFAEDFVAKADDFSKHVKKVIEPLKEEVLSGYDEEDEEEVEDGEEVKKVKEFMDVYYKFRYNYLFWEYPRISRRFGDGDLKLPRELTAQKACEWEFVLAFSHCFEDSGFQRSGDTWKFSCKCPDGLTKAQRSEMIRKYDELYTAWLKARDEVCHDLDLLPKDRHIETRYKSDSTTDNIVRTLYPLPDFVTISSTSDTEGRAR